MGHNEDKNRYTCTHFGEYDNMVTEENSNLIGLRWCKAKNEIAIPDFYAIDCPLYEEHGGGNK